MQQFCTNRSGQYFHGVLVLIGRFVDFQAIFLGIVIDNRHRIEPKLRRANESRVDPSSQSPSP